jgi:hypothetical protein
MDLQIPAIQRRMPKAIDRRRLSTPMRRSRMSAVGRPNIAECVDGLPVVLRILHDGHLVIIGAEEWFLAKANELFRPIASRFPQTLLSIPLR